MRKILVLFFAVSLVGCTGMKSTKPYIEAEDLTPITQKTVTALNDCLDYNNQKQCNNAKTLLNKHPWLLDRKVNITNTNGMRQNEWDIDVRTAKKNLDLIADRYLDFVNATK